MCIFMRMRKGMPRPLCCPRQRQRHNSFSRYFPGVNREAARLSGEGGVRMDLDWEFFYSPYGYRD